MTSKRGQLFPIRHREFPVLIDLRTERKGFSPRGTTTPISPSGEPEYQQLTRSTQRLHKSTQGSLPWRYKTKYLRASLMMLGATLRKQFLFMPVSHSVHLSASQSLSPRLPPSSLPPPLPCIDPLFLHVSLTGLPHDF